MSGNQAGQRELVYCHQCEDEWYKDQRGLQCPNCGSDIVEIIDQNADPRNAPDDDDRIPHEHPFLNHNPWPGDAPDPDEGDISRVQYTGPGGATFVRTTIRSNSPGQRLPPGMPDAFGPMFSSLMGNFMPANRGAGPGPDMGNRSGFGGGVTRTGATYTFSMGGPGNMRFTRTNTTGNMDDLNGIMGHFFGMLGGPPNMANTRAPEGAEGQPQMPPMVRMLMDLVGPLSGSAGDVAYTQEGYDRILTMLREQHQGSNAPGPASEAAINALPKIKITKEHLDEEGKADCSICMDSVQLGTEVTQLPCSHWFHGECVASWLKEHDTCPQCRRGITPKEGDQNTPRTTGQAPRYWQVNESDVNNLAREASRESQAGASSSRRRSSGGHSNHRSRTTSSSSRPPRREEQASRLGGIAGSIMRRLGGGGSGDGGGSHH